MIAVPDVGVFARLAFTQIAETLRRSGRRIRLARPPKALLRRMGPEARMLFWFGESGHAADIAALRRDTPDG